MQNNLTKKDIGLISKYKDRYRVEKTLYIDNKTRIELWRKHNNYGYYNFVCYLNSVDETEINNAILADIKKIKK